MTHERAVGQLLVDRPALAVPLAWAYLEPERCRDLRLRLVLEAAVRLWERTGGRLPERMTEPYLDYLAAYCAERAQESRETGYLMVGYLGGYWCSEQGCYGHLSGACEDVERAARDHVALVAMEHKLRRLRGVLEEQWREAVALCRGVDDHECLLWRGTGLPLCVHSGLPRVVDVACGLIRSGEELLEAARLAGPLRSTAKPQGLADVGW